MLFLFPAFLVVSLVLSTSTDPCNPCQMLFVSCINQRTRGCTGFYSARRRYARCVYANDRGEPITAALGSAVGGSEDIAVRGEAGVAMGKEGRETVNEKSEVIANTKAKASEMDRTNTVIARTAAPAAEEAPDASRWLFTEAAHAQLDRMARWEWTAVHQRVVGCGGLICLFTVLASRGLNVLLAFLSDLVFADPAQTPSPAAACGYFLGFGVALSLLPPVAGLSMYVWAGYLFARAGALADPAWSVAAAGGLAVAMSVLLKVCATLLQALLGRALWQCRAARLFLLSLPLVRAAAGVFLTRAWPSAALLVGLPDWPGAVLAGARAFG